MPSTVVDVMVWDFSYFLFYFKVSNFYVSWLISHFLSLFFSPATVIVCPTLVCFTCSLLSSPSLNTSLCVFSSFFVSSSAFPVTHCFGEFCLSVFCFPGLHIFYLRLLGLLWLQVNLLSMVPPESFHSGGKPKPQTMTEFQEYAVVV